MNSATRERGSPTWSPGSTPPGRRLRFLPAGCDDLSSAPALSSRGMDGGQSWARGQEGLAAPATELARGGDSVRSQTPVLEPHFAPAWGGSSTEVGALAATAGLQGGGPCWSHCPPLQNEDGETDAHRSPGAQQVHCWGGGGGAAGRALPPPAPVWVCLTSGRVPGPAGAGSAHADPWCVQLGWALTLWSQPREPPSSLGPGSKNLRRAGGRPFPARSRWRQ